MSRRRRWLESEISEFIRRYTRKHYATGFDPNDRHYDRKIEQVVCRMNPEDLDDLIYGRTEARDDAAEDRLRGERLPGVELALNDAVAVRRGAHQGQCGTVVPLLGTEPEPRYAVKLASDIEIEAYESALDRVGLARR